MTLVRSRRPAPMIAGSACLVLTHVGSGEPAQIGERFELPGEYLILGRGNDADLVVDLDAVSRRHARLHRQGEQWSVADLGSTNGTYVNDQLLAGEAPRPLASGDELRLGAALFRFLSGEDLIGRYLEELRRLGSTDGLTGVANQRRLLEVLGKEVGRAARYSRPLSIIRFDVSQLRTILDGNAGQGVVTGDHLLREVARRARGELRLDDLFAHSGGGRFVVVMPETDQETGQGVADAIRQAVVREPFDLGGGERLEVTLAVGLVTRGEELDGAALLRRAEGRLALS